MRHGRFKRVLFFVAILFSFAWEACVIAPAAEAQTGAANAETVPLKDGAGRVLVFDVASVRPSAPGGMPLHGFAIQDLPDGIVASWQNLRQLIQYAYGPGLLPSRDQIVGLPGWTTSQTYEIEAKMSADDIAEFQKLDKATQQQWRETMMRALLTDRFHLRVHRGTKQGAIYEMALAKGGAKFKDASTDTGPPRLGKNDDGSTYSGFQFNLKNTVAQECSMQLLAGFLSKPEAGLGRPVVDKTGLSGTYNFTLGWSVYPPPTTATGGAGGTTVSDPVPSVFDALEKVGLKLVPVTGMLDTIVVDHVEKLSEN